MRKVIKLMAITSFASLTSLQVVACKDNSYYDTFISDVNSSAKNNTAFFGFLGSKDDQNSMDLQNVFDYLNNPNSEFSWKKWVKSKDLEMKDVGINDIYLKYYQGPSHQDKPSDPVNAFWNDKNISWQKNIFNWVNDQTNMSTNPNYKLPIIPDGSGISQIVTKKDDDGKDMFSTLPILFIVSKGKLITAAQNWQTGNISTQYQYVTEFVLSNLLVINNPNTL